MTSPSFPIPLDKNSPALEAALPNDSERLMTISLSLLESLKVSLTKPAKSPIPIIKSAIASVKPPALLRKFKNPEATIPITSPTAFTVLNIASKTFRSFSAASVSSFKPAVKSLNCSVIERRFSAVIGGKILVNASRIGSIIDNNASNAFRTPSMRMSRPPRSFHP